MGAFYLGHWNNTRGVAILDNLSYYTDGNNIGNRTDWLCLISKLGPKPGNILADGEAIGTTGKNITVTPDILNINDSAGGENSDWAMGAVMIWDRRLSDQDMVTLNGLISDWKSGLVNPRIFFSQYDINYPILKDLINGNIINPLVWYKFDNGALLTDSGSTGTYNLTNSATPTTLDVNNFMRGDASVYLAW